MKLQDLFEAKGKSLLDIPKFASLANTHVEGDFYCSSNELTSLEGAPASVGKNFYCSFNQLTSLEGAPVSVGGDFYCSSNELTSLEGAPASVGADFDCRSNQLTSLASAPASVGKNFYCSFNQLTSLASAPVSVGGDFYFRSNQLTSLKGAPASVGANFYCDSNQLTSLKDVHKQIKHIGGKFNCSKNPIKSNVLGVLLIDGVQRVDVGNAKVSNILNKYLPNDRGMEAVFDCQEELINAGYKRYATL